MEYRIRTVEDLLAFAKGWVFNNLIRLKAREDLKPDEEEFESALKLVIEACRIPNFPLSLKDIREFLLNSGIPGLSFNVIDPVAEFVFQKRDLVRRVVSNAA